MRPLDLPPSRHRDKLRRSGAEERHLLLWVDTSLFAVCCNDAPPDVTPPLPPEITDLWVAAPCPEGTVVWHTSEGALDCLHVDDPSEPLCQLQDPGYRHAVALERGGAVFGDQRYPVLPLILKHVVGTGRTFEPLYATARDHGFAGEFLLLPSELGQGDPYRSAATCGQHQRQCRSQGNQN